MNFVVCVKQVPASNETHLDPVTHTILRDGAEAILNPFDAYAVEEALRLRERLGGFITALSMGIPTTEKMLREVLALGVDASVLLTDRVFAGSDTMATATALSLALRQMQAADLILCGRMASDGDTAQVGPMLARLLDIPCLTDVTRVERLSETAIRVLRLTDDGYQRAEASLPALITVTKGINVPRLPSLAGILQGETALVCRMNAADVHADPALVGLRGSATRVIKTERPAPRAACRRVIDAKTLLRIITEKEAELP